MRILLINHYAGSLKRGMEYRPWYLARELKKYGHDCLILAADYSHLRLENPDIAKDFSETDEEGVKFSWLKTPKYQGNGAKRAINTFVFSLKLYFKAKKIAENYRPEIVISSSTYQIDSYGARRIAKKAAAPHVHEIHDMWPATLTELGEMSSMHPFVLLVSAAEKYFCRNADGVISMLPCSKSYLVQRGMPPENWIYLPNAAVLDDNAEAEELPAGELKSCLDNLYRSGHQVILYFGGHALSNALDSILDTAILAANLAEASKMHFVLVGNGVEKERLMARKEAEAIDNLSFFSAIAKKYIPALLAHPAIKIVLITGKDSSLYRFGGSLNKIFDTLKAGKPCVLAMNLPENPIAEAEAGIECEAENQHAILKALIKIAEDDSMQAKMSQAGREIIAKKYNYENLAREFSRYIEKIRKKYDERTKS